MIVRLLLLATFALAGPPLASAWNVSCLDEVGEKCPDGYAKVRTPWSAHPQSEHRRLFERTLELSGLPASLRETFELTVHADDATLFGEEGRSYKSIRPVRNGARHIVLRELSVQAMSNLPDNSYTLWDWASGNEICPPDRGNADSLDCHNYETHIGWLNANHMLPQSQRFYEHLHRLALDRAKECKGIHDKLLPEERLRFMALLLACEKEALILEAVGHHYLQDSWSMGHMWERWGGVEIGDFRGSRPLGFAIAAFTGTIHGAGAMIPFGAADDPMCAPHADDNYVDDPDAAPREHPGVGDVYLEDFLFQSNGQWAPQRRALFGCAVDGVRAVYAETAQVHGEMQPVAPADTTEIDGSRHVTDLTCWRQRATNKAIATGCGIHLGTYPAQTEVLSGAAGGALIAGILPLALSSVLAEVVSDVETLPIDDAARFARDAAYTCTLAAAHAAIPGIAEQTNLAEGGLPSLVGVEPNSAYARGNAFSTPIVPPSSYADPALPWELDAASDRDEKEALNLTFADAHAADRCRTFTVADLNVYRSEVELAQAEGDPDVLEARCSQCAQLVAPHLRFGVEGNHDPQREAFCAFAGPTSAAFVYTGEDPGSFTGSEPTDLEAIREATATWCGCEEVTVSVEPTAVTLAPGATQQFGATVVGASDVAVTWTATGGTIDATGFFTAGTTAGTFTVRATSVAAPNAFDEAAVTISSASPAVTRVTSRGSVSATLSNIPLPEACVPQTRFSPDDATAWSDTISCDGSDGFGSSGAATATMSFTESYTGSDLIAVTASASGSASGVADGGGAGAAGYSLEFSVAQATDVLIDAEVMGGANDSLIFFLFRFSDSQFLIRDEDGGAVQQTVMLTPGRYAVQVGAAAHANSGGSASASFTLTLAFE